MKLVANIFQLYAFSSGRTSLKDYPVIMNFPLMTFPFRVQL